MHMSAPAGTEQEKRIVFKRLCYKLTLPYACYPMQGDVKSRNLFIDEMRCIISLFRAPDWLTLIKINFKYS